MTARTNKIKKAIKGKVIFSNKVKDYSKDPFVIEKTKRAERFMEKIGVPKELTNRDL